MLCGRVPSFTEQERLSRPCVPLVVRSQRLLNTSSLSASAHSTRLFEPSSFPQVFLIPLHILGEDTRLSNTQAARFRDSMCLRAGVDDDERNQPDFEITVEMWERASLDEYEIPTLPRTRDRRIEVWTYGSAKEKESPWAHAGVGVAWGSDYFPEISFAITRPDAQSNDRAELEAMHPPVAVMTDNECVSKGANLLLEARNNDGDVRLSQFHDSHREVWMETHPGTPRWMDNDPPCLRACNYD